MVTADDPTAGNDPDVAAVQIVQVVVELCPTEFQPLELVTRTKGGGGGKKKKKKEEEEEEEETKNPVSDDSSGGDDDSDKKKRRGRRFPRVQDFIKGNLYLSPFCMPSSEYRVYGRIPRILGLVFHVFITVLLGLVLGRFIIALFSALPWLKGEDQEVMPWFYKKLCMAFAGMSSGTMLYRFNGNTDAEAGGRATDGCFGKLLYLSAMINPPLLATLVLIRVCCSGDGGAASLKKWTQFTLVWFQAAMAFFVFSISFSIAAGMEENDCQPAYYCGQYSDPMCTYGCVPTCKGGTLACNNGPPLACNSIFKGTCTCNEQQWNNLMVEYNKPDKQQELQAWYNKIAKGVIKGIDSDTIRPLPYMMPSFPCDETVMSSSFDDRENACFPCLFQREFTGTVGMLVADVLFFIGADLFILQPLMTPLETLSGFFDIYYALVD